MRTHKGFTFVELLIVSAIIAALIAILMPVIAKARQSANRTRCAAQLQDIGRMLQMYFGEHKNLLPHVNELPSVKPPLNGYPSIAELLAPYDGHVSRAFQCPSDQITQPTQNAPAGFPTYYSREQSSYRWNAMINIRATHITNLRSGTKALLVDEYEPFHGPAGASGSMNHLYADFHVGDFEGNFVVVVK